MMIIADLIWIETYFDLNFLFRLDDSFFLRNFKNSILLNLSVIQFPCYFILVNVLDHDTHILWIASIRLCDNFSLEIYNWRFKYELGLDCLTQNSGTIVNFYRVFNIHWNLNFIVSSLLWIKLHFKSVSLLGLDHESEFSVLILVFLNNLLFLWLAIFQFFFINILAN